MLFAKKIKHILLLVFLVSVLASCDRVCYEADQFYAKMHTINANGKADSKSAAKNRSIFGTYNNQNGGEIIEWQDTGMVASGDYFMLAISGGWVEVGNERDEKSISAMDSCRLCFKAKNGPGGNSDDNCICGPILDNAELNSASELKWEEPRAESLTTQGETNDSSAINCANDFADINKCTCRPRTTNPTVSVSDLFGNNYISFSRDAFKKTGTSASISQITLGERRQCAYKMGVGLYISLVPPSSSTAPVAYHLSSHQVVCPIELKVETINGITTNRCIDNNGIDRTKVIYRSPDLKIFKKISPDETPSGDPERDYHQIGDAIKLNIYDQYLSDNGGKYKVEFLRGVISKEGDGLIADIVRTFDGYLFGSNIYNKKLEKYVKTEGAVEFMYKAVLRDKIVRNIISISLAMYISFYGLAFFAGMTDFGKKEIMMRLLKISLVILFTNESAWLMYNNMVVAFFKDGMDKLVFTISNIFESNMDRTLASVAMQEEANVAVNDVGRKFIYSDNLIMDLISKPNISRIFGLLWMPGTAFYALIYVPAILALIGYFIYMVLDVALKYMVNVLKICIGLALGPVFILFSLFEKTKDMFKNWVAFLGSRSLEIVILFTMLHPFLIIIDHSFKQMLTFEVCSANVGDSGGFLKYSVYKSSFGVDSAGNELGRGVFTWFEYFLKIGALIFITKSICDKAGYISGQLISIGGIANADPVTESGRGEGGFSMATAIAKGVVGLAKTAVTSSPIATVGKFAGRVVARNLTKIGRAEIGQSGSINDMVNNAFKSVGIRNRGIRSYMRDREVDSAFSLAAQDAKDMGLEGRERDDFIRQNTMKRVNMFRNENKNKATLLGLDNKNIQKRLDQKLVKEPMKNFIKEKAAELKEQGIFGKEAREQIEREVEGWAKQNFSKGVSDRKISDFIKKTSVQGTLKSSSEMKASQAVSYAQNLISSGDSEKAKEFIDKFRERAVESNIEKSQKQEDSKREGGKIIKGATAGVNLISKILRPIMVPLSFIGGKAYNAPWGALSKGTNVSSADLKSSEGPNNSLSDHNKAYKRTFSKVNLATAGIDNTLKVAASPINAFVKASEMTLNYFFANSDKKDKKYNFYKKYKKKFEKVNAKNVRKFFGGVDNVAGEARDSALGLVGYYDRNPRKNLRKFDRKLGRMLLELDDKEKLRGTKLESEISKFVDKEGKSAMDGADIKTIIQDRNIIKVKDSDSTLTKIGKYAVKGLFFPILIPANFAIKKYYKYSSENAEYKRLHRQDKLNALRGLAEKDASKINERLSANIVKNLGKDQQAKDAEIEKLKNSRENRDSMEKLALTMEKMQKSAREQENKERKNFKETIKKDKDLKTNAKSLAKADQDKRLKELSGDETIFERLSKIEKARGDGAKDLKSAYIDLVNKKIEEYSKSSKAEDLEKLKKLKGALFANMNSLKDDGKNKGNNELREIFNQVINVSSADSVGGAPSATSGSDSAGSAGAGGAPSATSGSDSAGSAGAGGASPTNSSNANASSVAKSNLEKQQELLKKLYEGERIIAEAEEKSKTTSGANNSAGDPSRIDPNGAPV